MNEKDHKILKQFAEAVRKRFPDAEIWGFGSRVHGNASPDSDLDVCIVIDEYNETADRSIIDIAWETGFENDIIISTVTYSKSDFKHGAVSYSPFIKSIISSGIAACTRGRKNLYFTGLNRPMNHFSLLNFSFQMINIALL